MMTWGDYYAGDCIHGCPADECETCAPSATRDTSGSLALLVAVLVVLGVMLGRAF